jgi:hypothetical protein
MTMISRGVLLAAAFAALQPPASGALAASEPPLTLHYTSRWAGLPAGEIEIRFEDRPGSYRSQIAIWTAGLPRWFTRFRGTAISEGGLSPLGLAAPSRYDATYDLRARKGKRVSVHYRQYGAETVAERGPEDSSEKFLLEPAQRSGVVDPLAALVRMREAIRTGLAQSGSFTIPVFDGKRRFDVVERGMKRGILRLNGATRPVIYLDLALQPVAGFKDNDPEGNPDDTSRAMEAVFSDDAELIPLRLEVTIAWLTAVVELEGRCDQPGSRCKAAFE